MCPWELDLQRKQSSFANLSHEAYSYAEFNIEEEIPDAFAVDRDWAVHIALTSEYPPYAALTWKTRNGKH